MLDGVCLWACVRVVSKKAEQKEKTIRTDRKGTGTENEMEKGTMCSPIIMFDNVSWMFF